MAENHTLSSRNGAFSAAQEEMDDEEALKWAALERLPTYDRLRKGILKENGDGSEKIHEIDVRKLGYKQRHEFIEKILRVAEGDNERFLLKLRQRIDNVGIELPKIEVRFENLTVDAKVHVGSRALPTLNNFVVNVFETILSRLYLWPSNKTVYNILDNVSGILKSTRMTLLLGPPGSGKSTFLLALAGKLDNSLNVKGRITYNGHELTEFVPQRTSAYISQHDVHIGEMTVRETLDFASRCQGVGRRYELLAELSRREKIAGIKPDPDLDVFLKAVSLEGQDTSLGTDYILKILGLDICADILLGDNMRRGISGGQKKRVTTGEMLVGPAKALFMDEISTGLDSSTTYQIVKCLRQSVHVMDGTMLVSLLQPAPETYELFDDLILLSEGQLVYQGPREQVLEFFENQGFKCPERKAVADFLQEVTSRKDQEQYWAHKNKPYCYVPVKDFADAFKFSRMGMLLSKELSTPYDRSKSHPAALVTRKYALKNWEMFKACFCREWILIKRNSFVYVFRTCQIFFLAAVTMTLFLHTTMHESTIEDGNKYMGALYFGLVSIMFNGFAELALTIFRLPVFYKQRDLLFYPAWAWSLPSIIARIPISLLETGIWVIMTYWTIGFAPETARFFRYFLVLFTCNQMSQALFRFVASLGRSMVVANTFGSFTLLIFFVLGGFILSRGSIPPWWIWGYWISPVMYAQNALAANEFLAERWNKPFNSQTSLGEMIIRSRDLFSNEYWYWLGVAAQIGFALIFNIGFTLALAYLKPLGETQAIMSKEVLYEKHENRTGENLAVEKSSSTSKAKDRSYQFMRSSKLHDDVAKDPPKRGMILPFQPLAVAFDHINYYVNMPPEMKKQGIAANRLQLLDDVSGAFRPGILTALVGVSGAGKTTLMDVLSGRKTGGYIEGTISISGYPKKQETFARVSGYCEQFDIHSPNVTVWESLYASAWLRLPKEVDTATRQMFVEKVMELVELTQLRNALVGLPAVTGLSTEQRKRLTIAVELVANPSIIFMDEPTSGLDARAAAIVMRTVRNTVDTGRTVVCTIHQPSIDIFEAFDELLLMKQGGQVIYAGPLGRHSQRLIDYFQAIYGVPKIIDGYNPATWMLEVTSQASEAQLSVDFANLYKTSTLYQCNQALIQELCTPAPGFQELTFPTKYSQSFLQQCIACLWKQHWSYWRNPHYCVVRMFFTTVCALMFGTICWNTGSKRSTQQDIFNLIGAMYSAVLFIGVNNSSTVQPVVAIERTVYYRERAAGMYSALPYAFAQVMIELPYILMQTLLYGVIVYFMMNFEWNLGKLAWFFLFTYLCFLYFTFYGMMVVALTPNDQIAAICSATFYGIWNLFAGFLIPRTGIPIWWRWYYWATPVAWTVHGLIASQLGNVETLVKIPGEESKTVKKFLEDYFGFHYDFLGVVVGVHIGLVLLFAFVFAFCIKFLNFQKR